MRFTECSGCFRGEGMNAVLTNSSSVEASCLVFAFPQQLLLDVVQGRKHCTVSDRDDATPQARTCISGCQTSAVSTATEVVHSLVNLQGNTARVNINKHLLGFIAYLLFRKTYHYCATQNIRIKAFALLRRKEWCDSIAKRRNDVSSCFGQVSKISCMSLSAS